MKIKRIETKIGIKEALTQKTSIETDVYNEVIIEKEVVPVILVPGIMGSRNKNSAGKVIWDPDRLGFLISFARKNKEKRKEFLIGESGFNPDYMQVIEKGRNPWWRTKLTTEVQDQRGWGGVMFGAYGNLLKELEKKNQTGKFGKDGELSFFIDTPVYAFGYNWTNDNKETAKALNVRIGEILDKISNKSGIKKVILVSHSMGGLVARACSEHSEISAKDKILGIIHLDTPFVGTTSAYRRIKAGFESFVTGLALGNAGDKVACLMIHMPGGLQLLPSNDFTKLSGKWLHVYVNGKKQNSYPIHDVYKDIYQGQEYYHLLDQRNFSESSDPDEVDHTQGKVSTWKNYLKHLDKSKEFHEKIGKNVLHEHTVQISSTNVKTTMELEYEVVTEFEELTIYVTPHVGSTQFLPKYSFFIRHEGHYGFVYAVPKKFSRDNAEINIDKGTRKEIENWWETDKQGQPVRHIKLFEYIKRDGDGTVVSASQEALPLDSSNELFTHLRFNGLEHQDMAGNSNVIRAVVCGVENFFRLYLQEIQNK